MESEQSTEHWTVLKKVPEHEMKILVAGYLNYIQKFKYLRYIIVGIGVVIIGYNLMVGGERFPLEELNKLKNTIALLMGVFVLLLLVLGWVLFKTLRSLKQQLNTAADKYGIDKKMLRKEFHVFVKTQVGGPGLR